MTQLLILSCIVIVTLAALLVGQSWAFTKGRERAESDYAAERATWANERRFLIDRAIAQHVGEVLALEREDTRKTVMTNGNHDDDRAVRPLLEGLS